MTVTQEYFADMKCDIVGCDHEVHRFYMHSHCHPLMPTWVYVDTENPVELIIICCECNNEIMRVSIAKAE